MTYFLLSILCSTALALIFKFSERFKVNLLRLISVNYLTCFIIGYVLTDHEQIGISGSVLQPAIYAIIIGCLFIITFYLLGSTTRHNGVTIAVIAQKLSLVIPVVFSFAYFGDSVYTLKICGIALAVPAVYFSSFKSGSGNLGSVSKYSWLPVSLFLASGATDTIVKLAQHQQLHDFGFHFFLVILFLTAAILSALAVGFNWVRSGVKLTKHEIWLGIAQGLVNYGSIYFFIKTLDLPGLESSFVFPVNNVSIVGLTALLAVFLFKEKLNFRNMIGLAIAAISIALISL